MKQIQTILLVISKKLGIEVQSYESGSTCQILVCTPFALKHLIRNPRKPANLKHLKMVVYDEADELFHQQSIRQEFYSNKGAFEKA